MKILIILTINVIMIVRIEIALTIIMTNMALMIMAITETMIVPMKKEKAH